MITITDRPAILGASINTRTENHGDDLVPAADIPVSGIMLSPEELNALLCDPHADRAMFNDDKGVKRPIFNCFKPFRLLDKFEGARVTITLSQLSDKQPTIALADCKLAKLDLEPLQGGLTAVSLTIQTTPTEKQVGQLFGHLGDGISIEIADSKRVEKGGDKQRELPMGPGEEGGA